jgi:hypothetical protein
MTYLSNEELLLKHLTQAFLYEGYVGILYPECCCGVGDFTYSRVQTACILKGDASTRLSVRVRFLQVEKAGEAIEREICPREATIDKLVQSRAVCYFVSTPTTPVGLRGRVVLQAFPIAEHQDAYRVTLTIENCTIIDHLQTLTPETALRMAFVSTHAILGLEEGEFISTQNPPPEWEAAVKECGNERTYPILIGESNRTVLCSPVILYDYPLVSSGLRGDIFETHPANRGFGHS